MSKEEDFIEDSSETAAVIKKTAGAEAENRKEGTPLRVIPLGGLNVVGKNMTL
jgi:hypothetical protein